MGTPAWFAYRYKNKYYREGTRTSGYPDGHGLAYAAMIPRNSKERKAWIQRTIAELKIRDEEHLADPRQSDDMFDQEIVESTDWITGEWESVGWSYIIDLDYRAFSVQGRFHFKLDRMPHNPYFDQYVGTDDEGETSLRSVPEKYLTTVSYWREPDFNVEEVSNTYDQLEPLTVDFEAWGAPNWDSLTVSQHLSVELVKTIVSDHKKTLAIPDLMSEFGKIMLIGWQVACAAAPSNVLCPAEATPSFDEARHAIVGYTERDGRPRKIPYQVTVDWDRSTRPYCRFRGCLIKFCLRLDEDAWFQMEVTQMVKQLRKNGRVSGVGILVSSFQLVAVAVDGSEVRCSPVMEFHDVKGDVRDGLLLLVHLLGPATMGHKIPWRIPPTSRCNPSSTLPEEMIQNVLRFTDDDTYHFVLPLVSRLVRSMCLARPRIGNFILTSVNPDGTYRVFSTQGPGPEIHAKLVRKGKKAEPGFLHVFQHHQVGVGVKSKTFDKRMEARRKREPHESTKTSWGSVVRGKDVPTMRVQVVGGVWGMVRVGEEVAGTT